MFKSGHFFLMYKENKDKKKELGIHYVFLFKKSNYVMWNSQKYVLLHLINNLYEL